VRLNARRAQLIRLGIIQGRAYWTARDSGWHVAALALLCTFRVAWGSDTLPRKAFERTIPSRKAAGA
jgi:hypothetical protein